MTFDKEDLAWAAGLFEGEGCFSYGYSNGNRNLTARINMTDRDVIEKFNKVFGFGTISIRPPQKIGWKTQWVWKVGSFEEVQVLAAFLWPWLCSRRKDKVKLIFKKYHKAEPESVRLTIDRTAAIKLALQGIINKPLWGRRWSKGITQKSIAKEFGISTGMITLIKQQMECGGGALRPLTR